MVYMNKKARDSMPVKKIVLIPLLAGYCEYEGARKRFEKKVESLRRGKWTFPQVPTFIGNRVKEISCLFLKTGIVDHFYF